MKNHPIGEIICVSILCLCTPVLGNFFPNQVFLATSSFDLASENYHCHFEDQSLKKRLKPKAFLKLHFSAHFAQYLRVPGPRGFFTLQKGARVFN